VFSHLLYSGYNGCADLIADLNKYFARIFQRIWAITKYKTETARIFKTCIAAEPPLPMTTVQVITRDDPHSLVLSQCMPSDNSQDRSKDCDEGLVIRAQVNARCQDLISVVGGRLEFLHRSVRDFLDESKSVSRGLDGHAGYYFDAHFTLLASYVFLIKRYSAAAKSGIGGEDLTATIMDWCNKALVQMPMVPFSPWEDFLVRQLDDSTHFIYRGLRSDHWSVYLPDGNVDKDNTK
jgi:hypothetical protein